MCLYRCERNDINTRSPFIFMPGILSTQPLPANFQLQILLIQNTAMQDKVIFGHEST